MEKVVKYLLEESKQKVRYEDALGNMNNKMALRLGEMKDRKKAVKKAKAISIFEICLSKVSFNFY